MLQDIDAQHSVALDARREIGCGALDELVPRELLPMPGAIGRFGLDGDHALKKDLPLFSVDGRMPDDGPQSVYNVLKLSDPVVKGAASIDFNATYTNAFVQKAAQVVK